MQIVLDALVKLRRIICILLRSHSWAAVLDEVAEAPPGCSCRGDPKAGVLAIKSRVGLRTSGQTDRVYLFPHIRPQWEPTAAWGLVWLWWTPGAENSGSASSRTGFQGQWTVYVTLPSPSAWWNQEGESQFGRWLRG